MVAGPEGRMVVASIPWHHALAFMPFSMTFPKIIAEPSWADCNQRNARRSQFDGKAVPMAQAAERLEDLSFCPHCRPPLSKHACNTVKSGGGKGRMRRAMPRSAFERPRATEVLAADEDVHRILFTRVEGISHGVLNVGA